MCYGQVLLAQCGIMSTSGAGLPPCRIVDVTSPRLRTKLSAKVQARPPSSEPSSQHEPAPKFTTARAGKRGQPHLLIALASRESCSCRCRACFAFVLWPPYTPANRREEQSARTHARPRWSTPCRSYPSPSAPPPSTPPQIISLSTLAFRRRMQPFPRVSLKRSKQPSCRTRSCPASVSTWLQRFRALHQNN